MAKEMLNEEELNEKEKYPVNALSMTMSYEHMKESLQKDEVPNYSDYARLAGKDTNVLLFGKNEDLKYYESLSASEKIDLCEQTLNDFRNDPEKMDIVMSTKITAQIPFEKDDLIAYANVNNDKETVNELYENKDMNRFEMQIVGISQTLKYTGEFERIKEDIKERFDETGLPEIAGKISEKFETFKNELQENLENFKDEAQKNLDALSKLEFNGKSIGEMAEEIKEAAEEHIHNLSEEYEH